MPKTCRQPARAAIAVALCSIGIPAWATNGMNMEGYGPISSGMGGASQAFDHGTAAMAQNPATLSLMPEGMRLDAAVGRLGPTVKSSAGAFGTAESGGNSYVMPAIGFARRAGPLVYGIGVFAQGGMGTEYGGNTFLAAGSGQPVRSELGVGRVLFPLSYQVTPRFAVGGSLDFMWASLDLKMAATGAQLGQLVTSASGNLGGALPALGGAPWARIDFSNSNRFSGAASSTGWAAKLGAVFQVDPTITVGASYHFKSSLKDMETGSRDASLSAAGGFSDNGRITVQDFQWPSMLALGVAWQPAAAWTVAADIKRINWADVMKQFKMRYDSAGLGGSVDFALPQNWENQTVLNLGVAYAVNAALTLRGGINYADNPVPAAFVHPLFPAIVETHFTLGAGYRFSPASELNASLVVAPTTTVTNAQGIEISHRQTNLQVMYTHRF